SFAAVAPQYGMFAATYGLAAILFAEHPTQVVITGSLGDRNAQKLEEAAHGVFRFGKAVLRVTPEPSKQRCPICPWTRLLRLSAPAARVCRQLPMRTHSRKYCAVALRESRRA